MFVSSALAVAASLFISGTAAAPGLTGLSQLGARLHGADRRDSTPSSTGYDDGYYYSWWTDGASTATYTNLDGGSYEITWEAGGNLVGGKGWNPGTSRTISYTADWEPVNNGNSYLSIYGWTLNPLIEYYVVEAHGEYNPGSAGTSKGSVTVDGASYSLYEATRTDAPSINGTQTFQQYWAIRDDIRTSGSVDVSAFFSAWESAGMSLGTTFDYQIVATEAYNSVGTSTVTVETAA